MSGEAQQGKLVLDFGVFPKHATGLLGKSPLNRIEFSTRESSPLALIAWGESCTGNPWNEGTQRQAGLNKTAAPKCFWVTSQAVELYGLEYLTF